MNIYRGFLIALSLSLAPVATSIAVAKKGEAKAQVVRKGTNQTQTVGGKKNRGLTPHQKLVTLKRQYRQGEINKRAMWGELTEMHEKGRFLERDDRVSLLQMQSYMLLDAGYPIISAIYASQAVKIAEKPASDELRPAWNILRQVSEKRPIQNLLEIVADNVDTGSSTAPVFNTDWNYFMGNAAARKGDKDAALRFYGKIKLDDRYFFPGKYQQAMLQVEQDKLDDAIVALKAILYPTSHQMSPLNETVRKQMTDYALVALGRIYYEKEQFLNSAKTYRMVSRDGLNFYDALFEQSWALFMGGYPMHALGSLYGAESPFFANVFNPEAPILRALVHYWLCRYEDSRNALADFLERHGDGVEKLNAFLDRQRLDPETAYQLFENMVSGVSSDSLGVPRKILETAAEKDSMLLVRDQYAAIIEEKNKLEAYGIFGARKGIEKPTEYMDRWAAALRKDVGRKFLDELQDMKRDFERLYAQAQFLYVELLMSEKEQILGKELHASSKITKVSKLMGLNNWAGKTQSWQDPRIGEYWWDEVGFYIAPVEPQCSL